MNSDLCQGRADITAQVGFLVTSSSSKDTCLTKTSCFVGGSLRAMPSTVWYSANDLGQPSM